MTNSKDESYWEEETASRVAATLKVMLATPPKPYQTGKHKPGK